MATDEHSWRTQTYRQSMVAKIEEAIQTAGVVHVKNSTDMENHVFIKAKSKEEYLGYIARLILHVREMNSKKNTTNNVPTGQGMPDPIGALQNLARQGTGNNQIMGMGSASNSQTMMQQVSQNTATNLLQSLNRPNQNIGMPVMQNKMSNMAMIGQTGAPMTHMSTLQGMQANLGREMLSQMNQMGQSNLSQQMQISNQMNQMVGNQMQPNMQSQMQSQLQNQLQNQIVGNLQSNLQSNLQAGMTQMAQIAGGNMSTNQIPQQLGHMQRKVDMVNSSYPGARNITQNQYRQSPSPSVPSPGMGASASNQMVSSPALQVPSPSPQQIMLASQQRSVGMAPSPGSSLNTPAGMNAAASPLQEDQAYKEKVRKLSKYIEPLRKMIAKVSSEGNLDKLSKMNKLLEILSNPTKRMPMDTLLKCEVVLENFTKRGDASVGPTVTTTKENHLYSPLLEAVSVTMQSPMANHTLHRTFGPCLESIHGPEIRSLPPPLKRTRFEEPASEIPDVLQAEIARLDQRFKVSIDPIQQTGSKCIHLICCLDDRFLPSVPPMSLLVPADYPLKPPRCSLSVQEYGTTLFLSTVHKIFNVRISMLPKQYSVSQLLDTWEMSVRQASSPNQKPITASHVLMGL